MPQFETFTKRMSPRVREPYVTVQKKGTMSINRASFELMGEPDAVELLFDPSERVMGMRKVDPTAPHAYPLRSSGAKQTSFLLSGMAFAKYYGIDTTVARRYVAVFADEVLQVDLNGEFTEVISNRAKASARRDEALAPSPVSDETSSSH